MKKKIVTVSKLKKKLDAIFSKYIRTKYSYNDVVTCVTCNDTKPIKSMQNGHYIPRNHSATRYDERNNHPQCVGCNMFKGGASDEYALFLIDKYGQEVLNDLHKLKHTIKCFTVDELEELILMYRMKLKDIT